MKKDIHPDTYRSVIFHDLASGANFLIGSTVATKETAKWSKATKSGSPGQSLWVGLGEDGKEYPKVNVEISSKSHPIYTGEDRSLDSGGQVEKFKKRAAAKKNK
ncbi:MAG: 50S ribosomal protein L31 [bacterium]|nr:50S ribosomal protein L31 [bacterium]